MVTSRFRTTLLRSQLLTMFAVVFAGCYGDSWHIDPDTVELGRKFELRPFYDHVRDLPDSDSAAVEKLVNVYGEFWVDYSENILGFGAFDSPESVHNMRCYLNDTITLNIREAIDTTSGSPEKLAEFSKDIEDGFKRLHALAPTEPIPDIILMTSGYNWGVYPRPRENYVAVGLEHFIGHDHPILNTLPPRLFPEYRKLRMHPDLMTVNVFRGWVQVNFQDRIFGTKLIDEVLYMGKVLWLVDKCMPDLHKHLLMDWTPNELAWAEANEENIWIELQPADILFESNRTIYSRWLTEGPFTRAGAIPQESPDRLGVWMGYQIVDDYMNANPETTVDELFNTTKHTPFLKTYRP